MTTPNAYMLSVKSGSSKIFLDAGYEELVVLLVEISLIVFSSSSSSLCSLQDLYFFAHQSPWWDHSLCSLFHSVSSISLARSEGFEGQIYQSRLQFQLPLWGLKCGPKKALTCFVFVSSLNLALGLFACGRYLAGVALPRAFHWHFSGWCFRVASLRAGTLFLKTIFFPGVQVSQHSAHRWQNPQT